MICPLCKCNTDTILTKKLRHGEPKKVFLCTKCDLGILDESKSAAELKRFYADEYRKKHRPNLNHETNAAELFTSHVNFQKDRIKIISPYLGKNKKLLEIGCSTGMFLFNVRDYVGEIVGIEFDANAAEYAAKKCDCKIFTEDIFNTPLKKRYFDIICCFQVLEHIKSPLEFLLQVKEYLKDDGVLFVEVPNRYDALVSVYDLPNHKQFYYHSAHTFYFSRKSLNILFEQVGLTTEFCFTQDYNMLNHFNWILNDKPQSSCIQGLSDPQYPFYADLNASIKQKMKDFLCESDKKYKRLLETLEISSNISCISMQRE